MVLHFITAALGQESHYGAATNQFRYEQNEFAKILDQKTLNCWLDHPNLSVIHNDVDSFDAKVEMAI